ncbi:MAG: glycosyltransferase, partial [Marinirhabdus sp.]
ESFGLSALEAMSNSVPVISSNAGGIPEVNVHGQSGYLSEIGDVREMAKNALRILKDEATLNRFKLEAKQAAKKFDTKNIVPMYEEVYEKALHSSVQHSKKM